ncbi:unnamed protein product [Protopolystoma xenopodis]|uniref:Uncharacterized protein n=1 Tax=Protopolystoma xenopodis TaxID=117903 RepID=A0A448XI31_9PLAT|nr:unnamed protein product [Protopolystoma xenopodis]
MTRTNQTAAAQTSITAAIKPSKIVSSFGDCQPGSSYTASHSFSRRPGPSTLTGDVPSSQSRYLQACYAAPNITYNPIAGSSFTTTVTMARRALAQAKAESQRAARLAELEAAEKAAEAARQRVLAERAAHLAERRSRAEVRRKQVEERRRQREEEDKAITYF